MSFIFECYWRKDVWAHKNPLSSRKIVNKTYQELVELVRQHLSPKPIVIAERYNFYNRIQRAGKSVAQYIAELRKLSEHCEFGAFLTPRWRGLISRTCLWGGGIQRYHKSFKIGQKRFYS